MPDPGAASGICDGTQSDGEIAAIFEPAWERVKQSESIAELEKFLRRNPRSHFRGLACDRIEKLRISGEIPGDTLKPGYTSSEQSEPLYRIWDTDRGEVVFEYNVQHWAIWGFKPKDGVTRGRIFVDGLGDPVSL